MYGLGSLWWILGVFGWLVPVIIATIIGVNKGKGGIGFILGLFLSWIGVIIVAVLENTKQREQQHAEMLAAVGGKGGQVVKVKCPNCGALADENVKFCPECGGPM